MTIQELQKWVESDWKNQSKQRPSVELQLLFVMEELGEVAEAIRKNDGAKARKQSSSDLGSEFADLIVSITTLANNFNVDLDAELEGFKSRLASRHGEGF